MPQNQMTYEWFAENYHFTEAQTDELSLEALEWWPLIRTARHEAARQEQAAQERVQKASRR